MSPDDIPESFLRIPLDRPDDTELEALQRLQNAVERQDSESIKGAILDYLKQTMEQKP